MNKYRVVYEKSDDYHVKVVFPDVVLSVLDSMLQQLYDLKKKGQQEVSFFTDSTFNALGQKIENAVDGILIFDCYGWHELWEFYALVDRRSPFKNYAVLGELSFSLEEWDLLDQLSFFVDWKEDGSIEYISDYPMYVKTNRFPECWLEKRKYYFQLFGQNGFQNRLEGWSGYMAAKMEGLGLQPYEEDFYWASSLCIPECSTVQIGIVVDPTCNAFHPFYTGCDMACCGEYLRPYPISQNGIDQMYNDVTIEYLRAVNKNEEGEEIILA